MCKIALACAPLRKKAFRLAFVLQRREKSQLARFLLVSTYRGNYSSSLVVFSYIMSHIVGQNRANRKKEEKSVVAARILIIFFVFFSIRAKVSMS